MKAIEIALTDRIFNHTHVQAPSPHGTFHAHPGAHFHMQPIALSFAF